MARARILFIFLLSILHGSLFAQKSFRELCRKGISGIYLSEFDSTHQHKMMSQHLAKQSKGLKKKLDGVDKKVVKAKKAVDKKEYDAKSSETLRDLENLRKSIHHQWVEVKDQTTVTQSEYVIKNKRFKVFDRQIRSVFTVVPSKRFKNYPDRLNYKEKCPKYRMACKLSTASARNLLGILENMPPGNVKSDCRKYAAQSGVASHY